VTEEFPELHERVTAGRLLSTTAAQVSKRLDSFCSWLLFGVGGAYTLVFANWASLQNLISAHTLRISLRLLLVAIVIGIFQRWLAAMVAAGSATGEKAEQIGRDLAGQGVKIDFKVVFREMERGMYYPAKWMARNRFNKAMLGDFAASGRITARISQVQSWLALVLVGFVVAAVAVTVSGVKV
jgi:hypothetical protein